MGSARRGTHYAVSYSTEVKGPASGVADDQGVVSLTVTATALSGSQGGALIQTTATTGINWAGFPAWAGTVYVPKGVVVTSTPQFPPDYQINIEADSVALVTMPPVI